MDDALIDNFNKVVTNDDIVYHLGDFSFGDNVEYYLRRLNGKEHHLILGNHDRKNRIGNNFSSVQDVALLNMKRYPNIWLSHYAHRVWPSSHRGSIHLFGHSHGNLKIEAGIMAVDVGVDVWNYSPVSLDEIVKYFKTP
jgi:calcineurin-like phosphoesterase family protein